MRSACFSRKLSPLAAACALGLLSACGGDSASPEAAADGGVTLPPEDAGRHADAGDDLMDAGREDLDASLDEGLDDASALPEEAGSDAEVEARPGLDARPANATCVAWAASAEPPASLSLTGCFEAADAAKPLPALIPFAPIAPLWSDNGQKQRWLAIPDGTTIALSEDGDFLFPPGTVLIKTFALGDDRLETRLFVHHPAEGEEESAWAGYAYEWNAEDTDATLLGDPDYLTSGKALSDVGDPAQSWHVPSRNQCRQCHTAAANDSLGLEVAQLDHALTYDATGRTANQLETLAAIGLLDASTPLPPPQMRRPLSPYVGSDSLEARARSYMHVNCSGCHRPGAFAPGDLRRGTALVDTDFCNTSASILEDTWPTDTKRIFPGDASRSAVSIRMRATSSVRMPPLGTEIVHLEGATVVDAWINSLEDCQ